MASIYKKSSFLIIKFNNEVSLGEWSSPAYDAPGFYLGTDKWVRMDLNNPDNCIYVYPNVKGNYAIEFRGVFSFLNDVYSSLHPHGGVYDVPRASPEKAKELTDQFLLRIFNLKIFL